MSAAKLEKKIWNLEQRLREEFHVELRRAVGHCVARVQHLEAEVLLLRGEKPSRTEAQFAAQDQVSVDVSGDAPLPGTVAEKTQEADVLPVARPSWPDWPEWEPNEAVAKDECVDWVPLEPVAFLESTWNLVLVMGFTDAGWLDIIIACLLLIASAGLQIAFSIILLSPDFLGQPFESHIQSAESWRVGVAHDYRHMDLAQTSLVSRVCNKDPSLIVSTSQATLLDQIDAFLGLLQPLNVSLGILLCMLCILLWCLYLCNEFRAIGLSLEAILQVPRRAYTTFDHGRFTTMSYWRFAGYCLARLTRGVIAGLLLYAGILWLGNTTSITDLMLNAVALGAVLDVDEMFFAALMPKKIQIKIQDLEAIKINYTRARSQIESVLLLLIMCGLMLWPWFHLVEPLGNHMLEVNRTLCGGNQDFVVGINSNQGITVGRETTMFGDASNLSLIEIAVSDLAFRELENASYSSRYILMPQEATDFENKRTELMSAAAALILDCSDFDLYYVEGQPTTNNYAPYWYNTAPGLGFPQNSSCQDMKDYCNNEDGELLRLTCGVTCGCAEPSTNPWFRVVERGCSKKCIDEMQVVIDETNCTDAPVDSAYWQTFWQDYPTIISNFLGERNTSKIDELRVFANHMRTEGCSALGNSSYQYEELTQTSFCAGHSQIWAPLSILCPNTCCEGEDGEFCPSSCQCRPEGQDNDQDLLDNMPTGNPDFAGIMNCRMAAGNNLCTTHPIVRQHCELSCSCARTD
ncbi:serS [Symbiodinium sp. CCMP2592]|nr:serS [Symbiodinium sp. CCMP2592]